MHWSDVAWNILDTLQYSSWYTHHSHTSRPTGISDTEHLFFQEFP